MTRRLAVTLPIVLSLMGGTVFACSVPVFRYALEHWRPDAYGVIVFHRGELSDAQQAQLAPLQAGGDDRPPANLVVHTVDLDQETDEAMTALWEEQKTDRQPGMLVTAPPRQGSLAPIWAGELTADYVARLVESPIRRQLQARLVEGDSVVWLFLNSGHDQADDAAYELLEAEVARLENVLELPEIDDADLAELSLAPEALKLKMSSLRVSRDDPAETFLVEMLLRVEPDLLEEPYVSQPMAFPVFGRGRALYALVGAGITSDTIEEACRFLTGACQCTVKAQNPGVDLLLSVDWDAVVFPALPYDQTPVTLAGLAGFSESPRPQSDDANSAEKERNRVATAAAPLSGERSPIDPASDFDADDHASQSTDVSASLRVYQDEGGSQLSTETSSSPSIAGSVLLVIGLLAMCVIVATMLLLPRSR